jgi:transposase-like protein
LINDRNRARRRFTPQQKEETVALYLAEQPTFTDVTQRLRIPVRSLAKWVRQARIDRGNSPPLAIAR